MLTKTLTILTSAVALLACAGSDDTADTDTAPSSDHVITNEITDGTFNVMIQSAYTADSFELTFDYTKPDGTAATLKKTFAGGNDRLMGELFALTIKPNTAVSLDYSSPTGKLSQYLMSRDAYRGLPMTTWIIDLSGSDRYAPAASRF